MNEIKLTKRLLAAAQAVREGARVADVGCDHGKLAAQLVASGKCPVVIATDINDKPLGQARELFRVCRLEEQCRALLCDGLDGVDGGEVDDVVIAGLGADAAISIIRKAAFLRDADKCLVLVPSSRHGVLRGWLLENGFALERERAVCEAGKCYSVITARFTGERKCCSAAMRATGLIADDGPDSRAYLKNERKRAERLILSGACDEKKRAAREVITHIDEVLQ
ncbi:MAG: class I SAM-dependent methyltransferase [Oscillospiraceae bacterium]